MKSPLEIIKILSRYRFGLGHEKGLQVQIAEVLSANQVTYEREYRLDEKNIPDFFIDGLAIEIKIQGSAKLIYRQIERYSKSEEVKEILLVTNRTLGLPTQINGKNCYIMQLGKAWL